jgi:HK97 family phage portal protein
MFNGQPAWTPRKFDQLAKEGFEENVWVYRCVMAIAQAAAGVEWNLYQNPGKGQREIEEHALLKLINKPNPFQSKREFFEAMTAYVLLAGNSYIEKVGPNVGPPMELYTLRPDRMAILPDSINFVAGYEYTLGANKKRFDANKVMHIKLFAALDDYYGLSPIAVGAKGIDNDNAASTWNNSLLNNSARPSGAMSTESHLTDPQYDRLQNELDTNYRGAKKAGKPLLLEGGLKWQEMGLSPRDMDFIESKKLSRVEICAAFGVPPEIVGDKEHATYSNYQEARQAFYQETVLPMLDLIRDKMNADLVPLFGENLKIDYDRDSIEALQENTDIEAKRIREDVKAGLLTVNEAREARGYEALDKGEVLYIPANVNVVGLDGKIIIGAKPVEEEKPPKDEEGDGKKNFFFNLKAFNMESDEQKTAFWESMEKRRNRYYKGATAEVAKRFEAEKKAVIEAFKAGGMAAVEKAVNAQKPEWIKLFTALDVEVMQDFGNATFNHLKHEAADMEIKGPLLELFNVFHTAVQKWITGNVAKKVVMVTDTTKELIKLRISKGEAEGEGIPEIAARIDELYLEQIIPNRSTVIARTEVISSSNAANRFAAQQTGLPLMKEWISTRDDRTRDTHEEVNGQTREFDEFYDVGKAKLLFPGDPNGPADEVIQCRCTEGYSVKKK